MRWRTARAVWAFTMPDRGEDLQHVGAVHFGDKPVLVRVSTSTLPSDCSIVREVLERQDTGNNKAARAPWDIEPGRRARRMNL